MNSAQDSSSLDKDQRFTLAVFVAEWCPYCLLVQPAAHRVSECTGCEVCLIDIDQESESANDWQVNTLPTLILHRAGEVIARWEGQTIPEDIPEFFCHVIEKNASHQKNCQSLSSKP